MLVNPQRSERGDEVLGALEDLGVRRLEPAATSEIGEQVDAAVADGADTVVAVGGDGTQRLVGAALAGTSTALGVIPGGSVNLLAQILGLDDVAAAVDAVVRADSRAIDVGTCNGEVFILNSSSGYDAAVIAAADSGHKARFGRLTFVHAAVSALRRTRPRRVVVTVDGSVEFSGRAMSVITTNVAERSSADLKVAPAAEFDDGQLDVLIVRATTPVALVRLAWTLARGGTPRRSDLLRATGEEIVVEWSGSVDGQIDGDPRPRAQRFRYQVAPGALRVHV
nr:hypothetical protein [uncultured bacterium]